MSIEWLEQLETRVREAAGRLGELRDENRGLQERIGELEIKLAAATTEPSEGAGELAEARQENEALRRQIADLELELARVDREGEEVRGRVERLTRHLEGLLGPDQYSSS